MQFLEFIDAWKGKWLSQRTNYNFECNEAANAKSEIAITRLTDSPVTLAFQEKLGIPATETEKLIVLILDWNTSVDWGQPKQTGQVVYGFLPNATVPEKGQLWRGTVDNKIPCLAGHYYLAEDECLTLHLQAEQTKLTERHWYASPNLRLRTSLIEQAGGYSHSAFYSDIRRLPPKESPSSGA